MRLLRSQGNCKLEKDYPRSDRISQQVKKELANLFQNEIKDPALRQINILEVSVSPCLKFARIFYVVHEYDEKEFNKGLKRSMSFIRTSLSKRMTTRGIPKLEFIYDKSFDDSYKLDKLINNLSKS